MPPGNAELDAAQGRSLVVDGVERAPALHRHVRRGVVGVLPAVGDAVGVARADVARAGVVLAVEDLASRLAAEAVEDALDVVEVAVEVQVLRLDVEDDAVLGEVVDERAVALVALGDEVFAVLVPVGVRAQHGDLRADVVAGAEPPFAQQVRREGGGRGLAVRAGDDDALLVVEDGGEAVRAAQAEAAALARGAQGGVVFADRAGVDDDFGVLHRLRIVGAGEHQSRLLQPLRFHARHAVAAADAVPHFHQHAGEPAHAGSRHSDQVDAYGMLPVQQPFA